ncbi:MAG: hypothetical protein JWO38_4241 [Gemmataceae bacterium]|nr:hypothetical protein [Gemmataceae bacterium]
MTLDTPIDGSSHEGVMKMKVKGTVKFKQGAVENESIIDLTGEGTTNPVK